MDTLYDCLKASYKYGFEVEYFWISGVTLLLVGVFGVGGNILNLTVLFQEKFRKKVFYNLLIEMACFDILFIIGFCLESGYQSMACNPIYGKGITCLGYLVLNFGMCGSIYTTIAVSIERFLRMKYPYLKKWGKSWIYLPSVAAITFAYNLPRCFEYKFSTANGTLTAENRAGFVDSDAYETWYTTWTQLIVESIIPTFLLFFLNGSMVKMMYFNQNQLLNTSKNIRKCSTKILFVVYLVFLICHIPTVIRVLLDHFGPTDLRENWYIVAPIEKLVLVINSSVNFIIYCLVGTKFRDQFLKVFRCKI